MALCLQNNSINDTTFSVSKWTLKTSQSTTKTSSSIPLINCPYCMCHYRNPILLPCGHALCESCSNTLLLLNESEKVENTRVELRIQPCSFSVNQRTRIRMGIQSFQMRRNVREKFGKNSSRNFFYKSPSCPVCFAPAKLVSNFLE